MSKLFAISLLLLSVLWIDNFVKHGIILCKANLEDLSLFSAFGLNRSKMVNQELVFLGPQYGEQRCKPMEPCTVFGRNVRLIYIPRAKYLRKEDT